MLRKNAYKITAFKHNIVTWVTILNCFKIIE